MTENPVADSISMCDRCGSYSGITVEYFEQYRIPDEYDTLCTDCAEEENTHTAEQMSGEELTAAIVDDSIGYASPAHAARHVEDFREGGESAYCERGAAVFGRDLDALIESARAHWLRTHSLDNHRLGESVLWRPLRVRGSGSRTPTALRTGRK